MQINYEHLKQVFKQKGYAFFDNNSYNLNVFGIRGKHSLVNEFDDVVGLAFKDTLGNKQVLCFKASTDPGYYWLKHQMGNSRGTAILCPGQYKQCWVLGSHKGYDALQQSDRAKFKVWRDNNANGVLDETGAVYADVSGLNCHTTSFIKEVDKVGKYSAGCQVIQDDLDFLVFLSIIKKSAAKYGNYFSYTLLRQEDL